MLSASDGPDSSVAVWDCKTYELIKKLGGHDRMVTAVRDLCDGQTVATSSLDSKIAIWKLTGSTDCLSILENNSSGVISMDFNPEESALCSGSIDGWIHIWQIVRQDNKYLTTALRYTMNIGHAALEVSMSACIPNQVIVLCSDYVLRLY